MMSKEKNNASCPICNRIFIKGHYNQRYCGEECAAEMTRRNSRARDELRRAEDKKKRGKRKKEMSELARINQLARTAGMTYGKYILMQSKY